MRKLLLFVILISSAAVKAQTPLTGGFMNYMHPGFGFTPHVIGATPDKKWFVSSYSGLSTSFGFYNGGSTMVVAAPIGLQLNRKINNNLYAFAGVSAAPAYVGITHTIMSADMNKAYQYNGMFAPNNLAIYSRAELGLTYVNDARTFSISGSVGVERSSYPMPYQQMNPQKTNSSVSPNRQRARQ
ncbi:MAG: hypothetical protein ABUT20_35625 [Bacteroidota bacterium]